MNTKKTALLTKFTREHIFLVTASLVLIFNLFTLSQQTIKMAKIRKHIPYTFLGDRFMGLDAFLGHAPQIGYYTDKNLDDNLSARQFAQAQLILAPTILDLNNTAHEFILFDCTSPKAAIQKIQELGAQALKANQYGIILARNPNVSTFHKADTNKTFDPSQHQQIP
ncbi:MAG: hypothetical protein H6753_00215 [Candidatus Omnitrophica bacterium]|nr:hypothetical protein [Candidatus Omnitrophota bacterium]